MNSWSLVPMFFWHMHQLVHFCYVVWQQQPRIAHTSKPFQKHWTLKDLGCSTKRYRDAMWVLFALSCGDCSPRLPWFFRQLFDWNIVYFCLFVELQSIDQHSNPCSIHQPHSDMPQMWFKTSGFEYFVHLWWVCVRSLSRNMISSPVSKVGKIRGG